MNKVFVLGNGASCCCGIPVSKNILSELIEINDKLYQFIDYFQPELIRNGLIPNIEDVLNYIESISELVSDYEIWDRGKLKEFEAKYDKIRYKYTQDEYETKIKSSRLFLIDLPFEVQYYKKDLLCKLSNYLWGFYRKQITGQMYLNKFVKDCISLGDTIITFNYDLLLEKSLENNEIKYSYLKKLKDGVRILKMHGSINWYLQNTKSDEAEDKNFNELVNDYGYCFQRIFKINKNTNVYQFKTNYINQLDMDNFPPYLIPPSAMKKYPELFKELWGLAYEVLEGAGEIKILGYSLPPVDNFAKFFFRRLMLIKKSFGLNKNITVYLPRRDKKIVSTRYKKGISSEIKYVPSTFENAIRNGLL